MEAQVIRDFMEEREINIVQMEREAEDVIVDVLTGQKTLRTPHSRVNKINATQTPEERLYQVHIFNK